MELYDKFLSRNKEIIEVYKVDDVTLGYKIDSGKLRICEWKWKLDDLK